TDSEKLAATTANEKKAAEKILTDLTDDLKNTTLRFNELKKSVLLKLQPLGIEGISDSDISSLLLSLKERLKGWQGLVKKKAAIEKQISALDSELQRLDAVIDTRSKALTQKQTALKTTRERFETINSERQKLFGNKVPDDEETRLNKTITDTELAEKLARTAYDAVKQKLNSAKVNIASLSERIEKRVLELKDMESTFSNYLKPAGFADENQFLKACLKASDRDELKTKAKGLDDRQTQLLARQQDRKNRLSTEIARKVTESNIEELEPSHKELEENLKQLHDTIAGLKHKLAENSAAKERIKEKQALIEAQRNECQRWEKLQGLIGSADGKKYRNFAQGLTFELMVSHANRQLEKMTDRYLLIRDKEQALALNVVDNYQAGEIRSTKNLSGGESFIVSLTLALGLSKMASRKVRVDSLFLDEGFGTLDEEALETALETLSGLQQDGKLIGIISHVSALKERISTQVSIVPLSGGKSTITGPGCQLLSGSNKVQLQ
ncbi:MAG TPA: chromosome segregation protein SMC, partial [Desulfobacterales bacterium]|nr:chromosome segregation protein SMC [Desulfobacterales bacterium]